MEPHTTPPGSPWDDGQETIPSTTMTPRSRRPERLRTAVFWELTDRRHYPPSPDTGLTLFIPVPYPYKPSPRPTTPENDNDENDDEITTFDGVPSPKNSKEQEADVKERIREKRHQNGYPIASSPSSRKISRTTFSTVTTEPKFPPTHAPSSTLSTETNLSPQNSTPEDFPNTTHLSTHLSDLNLHSHRNLNFSTTPSHIARKARIRNTKTIERFEPYRPRDRYKDKMEANMSQLNEWADEDEERKVLVGRILHARGEQRTRGLSDPFGI